MSDPAMTGLRVSVLVPTWNRPALLTECLASLTRQTMAPADFEVIVVNDGGCPVDPVLPAPLNGMVLNQPENRGQSAALNMALRHVRGRYVTVANDDDTVLPVKLARLAEALDVAPPEVSAVYGLPVYTEHDGSVLGCPAAVRAFMDRHPVVTSAIALADGLLVHGTAAMYRRDMMDRVQLAPGEWWDEQLPTAEEWDFHHRLLRFAGPFHAVPVEVVTYRAGGKHGRCKTENGKRPRATMHRIYDRLGVARRDGNGKVMA